VGEHPLLVHEGLHHQLRPVLLGERNCPGDGVAKALQVPSVMRMVFRKRRIVES
jgi:hypothetical protein